MLLSSHVETPELENTVQWYKDHFQTVRKVYCGSDLGEGCGALLALEVSGGVGVPLDERGVGRITIGSKLLSTRVRLDEHSGGRMVGYECICGNDTRLSEAERHHEPQDGWTSALKPFEDIRIAKAIRECGHKAKFKRRGHVLNYESFSVEEVK